jgi:hypothetical protein
MDSMNAIATATATTTTPRPRSLFDADIVEALASGAHDTHQRGIPYQLRTLLYRGQDGGYWTRRWAEPPCERARIEPLDSSSANALYETLPIKLAPLGGE